MQQFYSIFVFYKPLIIWSIALNMVLLFLKYEMFPILILKVLLVVFLWYYLYETPAKQKLLYFKNLGISTLKMFSYLVIIDLIISVPFLLILEEFI